MELWGVFAGREGEEGCELTCLVSVRDIWQNMAFGES